MPKQPKSAQNETEDLQTAQPSGLEALTTVSSIGDQRRLSKNSIVFFSIFLILGIIAYSFYFYQTNYAVEYIELKEIDLNEAAQASESIVIESTQPAEFNEFVLQEKALSIEGFPLDSWKIVHVQPILKEFISEGTQGFAVVEFTGSELLGEYRILLSDTDVTGLEEVWYSSIALSGFYSFDDLAQFFTPGERIAFAYVTTVPNSFGRTETTCIENPRLCEIADILEVLGPVNVSSINSYVQNQDVPPYSISDLVIGDLSDE